MNYNGKFTFYVIIPQKYSMAEIQALISVLTHFIKKYETSMTCASLCCASLKFNQNKNFVFSKWASPIFVSKHTSPCFFFMRISQSPKKFYLNSLTHLRLLISFYQVCVCSSGVFFLLLLSFGSNLLPCDMQF